MTGGILERSRVMLMLGIVCGAVLGALIALAWPSDGTRYRAEAEVALLPAPNLPIAESASFWEVLTSGQVSKTAAIVYQNEARWLPSAAQAAGVPTSDLTLTAAEIPDTSIVSVAVEGPSEQAATRALDDVLRTANPQVARVSAPFVVNVMWPAQGSAEQVAGASTLQIVAAGLFGGAIVGAGVALLLNRWARRRTLRGSQARTSGSGGENTEADAPPPADATETTAFPLPEERGALAAGLRSDERAERDRRVSKPTSLEGPGDDTPPTRTDAKDSGWQRHTPDDNADAVTAPHMRARRQSVGPPSRSGR